MNVSFNLSTPNQINTADVPSNVTVTQSSRDTTLTVSITPGDNNANGVPATAITLTYPMIGMDDIQINELLQDLKNLNVNVLGGMTISAAVLVLNKDIGEIASAMVEGGTKFIEENKESLIKFFDGVEEQAKKAETALYDLINNSTYPDFNDFLGKMLTAAQELREKASVAKHHLVMGQYENVLDQAKQMEIAAQKNYESTMKEIEASRTEAIGKIVGGVVNIASTVGVGMTKFGAQVGQGIGGALSGITDGISSLIASHDKMDAAALKKEADLAGAIQKKLEAVAKLLGEAEQLTDELKDIAKTLADMVLKLYQDFISSQNQIIQRANV